MLNLNAITVKYERKEYLKRYIRACLRDSLLSWQDVASFDAVGKVLAVLSKDVKVAVTELAKESGGSVLRAAGAALSSIAEDVVSARIRR
jgi:hypothetical protein